MQVALQSNLVRQDLRSVGVRDGGNAVREVRQEKGSAFAVKDIVTLSEAASRRPGAKKTIQAHSRGPGPVNQAIQVLVDEVLDTLLHHPVITDAEKPER